MKVGERSGLLATAFDRVGNVIPTVRIAWSSNNVAVAKVDNSGTVTGVGGGVAIIEAHAGTRKGQAAVQVVGPPGASTAAGGAPAAGAAAASRASADAGGADPLTGQPAGSGPATVLRIEPPTVYLLPSENTRVSPRALKDDGTAAAPVAVTWKSLRPDRFWPVRPSSRPLKILSTSPKNSWPCGITVNITSRGSAPPISVKWLT